MQLNIIILTYNCLDEIKQCLDSIYKHTKQDFNLFIVENDSQDGTREYIKKIAKEKNNIHLSLQEKNLGIIKGRNAGFDLFKTISKKNDYIMFLDADQYVKKNWLDSYLEIMKEFDIIGVEAWLMRESDFYPYKRVIKKEETYSYVGAGGMMMKSSLFEKLGGFDEDFEMAYFEDPSLCFLAREKGYEIGWNYNPVIIHNHSGPLMSSKNRKYFMKNWKTFQKKWKK